MNYSEEDIKKLLPTRPKDSHKGTFGHVLNIAGSKYYSGAAYFSSIAPLKVGAGRSTLASIEFVINAVASLSPDIILLPLKESRNKTIKAKEAKNIEKKLKEYNAISIGCGLSDEKESEMFFIKTMKILADEELPVVIDADGLNILSRINISLPINTILTPHPKEFSKLMKISIEEVLKEPKKNIEECCKKYNCTVVLKTHETLVMDTKGDFYQNKTGNSALSHGGSGDVLSGMITGFLATGLSPFEASSLAVYLHGKAAELASESLSEYSAITSNIIEYIPKAIKTLLV